MHLHAKFHQNPSIHCGDTAVFQDDGHPPCWICLGHIWTTHKGYLVVFMTMQNLVAIDAIVLKMGNSLKSKPRGQKTK